MQWSKLKSRIKGFIRPELRSRIDFHLTSYRKSHDGADKVWIVVDGQRVFSFNHYPYEWAEREAYWSGMNSEQVKDSLQEMGMHSPNDFGDAIREYLDTPISQALESTNPIIKAFALVDSRTGKRTIDKMLLSDSEHSLVKAFYELRKREVVPSEQ